MPYFSHSTCLRHWGWLILLSLLFPCFAYSQTPTVSVGSKAFTESVILGEMATHAAQLAGYDAVHKQDLGGTRFLWNALLTGDLDVYPEYTGTLRQEILADAKITDASQLDSALATFDLRRTQSLGFNNTYALGMLEERAAALDIRTISDLREHTDLVYGFTNEFMDRGDGWPGLRARYSLTNANVQGLQHDLAYRGLVSGGIDVIDLYSTDAEIAYYNIRPLVDDQEYFPRYDAVFLYRSDLADRAPELVAYLHRFEGALPESTMVRLNAAAKLDRVPERQVAASFVTAAFALNQAIVVAEETWVDRLWVRTAEHLWLVAISLAAAILVAIPLGIVAARYARIGQVILGIVGIIYTIPALALLVFMIPLLGIGGPPAMMALFLYSLLPIVRNTHSGLHDISPALLESAEALGLPPWTKLVRIELPLASRAILAGIKTSAVINVGTATLGALIGAGGYGQPILTGIRLDDIGLILEGAIPSAVLAVLAQLLFEAAERWLIPQGLRA